jgi:hypothetical protein
MLAVLRLTMRHAIQANISRPMAAKLSSGVCTAECNCEANQHSGKNVHRRPHKCRQDIGHIEVAG